MKLDELEKLAREATPGKWPNWNDEDIRIQIDHYGLAGPQVPPSDCNYITAANPETVLKLIAELRALRLVADAANQIGCGQGADCLGYGFLNLEEALAEWRKLGGGE
jgi:hypothetical protein